ncbi:MAG: hypothetical protein JJT89_17175 [Nitriliruptoraceae bacterium]|nr:hypothetical protein [Nitriliruptoraceae bacterium]
MNGPEHEISVDTATAHEQGHLVWVVEIHMHLLRLLLRTLEQCPTHLAEVVADGYRGDCSCGAKSQHYDSWEEARQWCRDHRRGLGYAKQDTLEGRMYCPDVRNN